MQEQIKAIIFDVDGTLIEGNSWRIMTEQLGASMEEHKKFYDLRKERKISEEEAQSELLKLWSKTGKANQENLTKIFSDIPLKKEAADIVAYLNLKNYKVSLITGSMDLFAKIIAEKLDIKFYFANTDLIFDEQGILKHYTYDIDQSKKKLAQLRDFCKQQDIFLTDCAAVGDSENDYDLFTATGKGIVPRTKYEDKILENVAWKSINNLAELKNIL